MAELSKGIRLASDSGITLNNRLFEDPKDTLLFTFRPDAPPPAITGDRLLLGSDKGLHQCLPSSRRLGRGLPSGGRE